MVDGGENPFIGDSICSLGAESVESLAQLTWATFGTNALLEETIARAMTSFIFRKGCVVFSASLPGTTQALSASLGGISRVGYWMLQRKNVLRDRQYL